MASWPAPAASSRRCASPPACDAARSRCSVETYSSPSRRASSSARSMSARTRGSSESWPPCTLARRDSTAASSTDDRAGSAPSWRSVMTGMPSASCEQGGEDVLDVEHGARRRAWPAAGRPGWPPGPSGCSDRASWARRPTLCGSRAALRRGSGWSMWSMKARALSAPSSSSAVGSTTLVAHEQVAATVAPGAAGPGRRAGRRGRSGWPAGWSAAASCRSRASTLHLCPEQRLAEREGQLHRQVGAVAA